LRRRIAAQHVEKHGRVDRVQLPHPVDAGGEQVHEPRTEIREFGTPAYLERHDENRIG
jgi:hypothetical protein